MIDRKAIPHLKRADPVMADVIRRVGAFKPRASPEGTHFDAVVRSIVYQQLSTKAATTIHGRLQGLFGDRPPLPQELSATSDERLRSAGLSRQKIGYMRDLADRVLTGDVSINTVHDLDDEMVIAALTRVKGVGRWTAQMFLMFRLGRANVLPEFDLGIQKAIKIAYGLRKMPTPERVRRIGANWDPYCSIASWYLWRSLDLPKERQAPSTR